MILRIFRIRSICPEGLRTNSVVLQLKRYMASVAIAKIVTISIPLPCAKRKLSIKVLGRLPEVSKNL